MDRPLIATADAILREHLLRLAAAAGVSPDVAADAGSALRRWSGSSMVLVGHDLAAEMARLAPARRAGVHVVVRGELPPDAFRVALALGAESVSDLPRTEAWVTGRLTDVGDSAVARGLTVGVLGGAGGAGATTFACALAQTAARGGPAVAVDLDPLGPGVDRVLALERHDGVRWDTLAETSGRLSSRSLRDALPRRGGLSVLTWGPTGRSGPPRLDAVTVREALSAAQRGHDTVVLDLPRVAGGRHGPAGDVVDEVVARCDLVLVVVTGTLTGTASAARTVAALAEVHDRSRGQLVVRGAGADPVGLSRLVGLPVAVAMADQRGLTESIDLGLGPVRSTRGPLGRAAADVLARAAVLVTGSRGAA